MFAATSVDGFLYLFDLLGHATQDNSVSSSSSSSNGNGTMAAVLEAPLHPQLFCRDLDNTSGISAGGGKKQLSSASSQVPNEINVSLGAMQAHTNYPNIARVGLTAVAFNPKRRALVAACDCLGRVHLWRLNWELASVNRKRNEDVAFKKFGTISGNED